MGILNMKKILFLSAACLVVSMNLAFSGETASVAGTTQYIVNLKDGDVVSSPVTVIFGLSGMGIAPAGTDKENTGHHHLFLDREPLGEGEDGKDELDANIISDENNIHYGKGQTETSLDLKSGTHTLQLVLGDKDHIPHNPPVSSKVIKITVK